MSKFFVRLDHLKKNASISSVVCISKDDMCFINSSQDLMDAIADYLAMKRSDVVDYYRIGVLTRLD